MNSRFTRSQSGGARRTIPILHSRAGMNKNGAGNLAQACGFVERSTEEIVMADAFERLREAHIGREEDQPLILAVLIVLIALTLLFFL